MASAKKDSTNKLLGCLFFVYCLEQGCSNFFVPTQRVCLAFFGVVVSARGCSQVARTSVEGTIFRFFCESCASATLCKTGIIFVIFFIKHCNDYDIVLSQRGTGAIVSVTGLTLQVWTTECGTGRQVGKTECCCSCCGGAAALHE